MRGRVRGGVREVHRERKVREVHRERKVRERCTREREGVYVLPP